jgi:hypothetical protein
MAIIGKINFPVFRTNSEQIEKVENDYKQQAE